MATVTALDPDRSRVRILWYAGTWYGTAEWVSSEIWRLPGWRVLDGRGES